MFETATARDSHHFAVLIGFGATAVYPYLAYEVINHQIHTGEVLADPKDAYKSYRKGIGKGLLKILSKMGISTIASYRGAQLFEAVGLSQEVTDLCFCGVSSRIQGARFDDFHFELGLLAGTAWRSRKPIQQGGLLKYVHDSEYHSFNPDVLQQLQRAAKLATMANIVNTHNWSINAPVATLRDMFRLKTNSQEQSVDDVEPIKSIVRRFDSAAMSLGALSPEAHESLAQAMNRLGGRSNSGEGGEDEARFGTNRVSKIKQNCLRSFWGNATLSGKCGSVADQSGPRCQAGEGGQLPGGKVNELIARLRYSVPGVTLISPPPHHDIYSIEDLAQLIMISSR